MNNKLLYDGNGTAIYPYTKPIFCGAVLDAAGGDERYLAMKQLFDIAKKRMVNPTYEPSASEFSYATKGAVCILPDHPEMHQGKATALWSKDGDVQAIPASSTKAISLVTGMDWITNIKTETITIDSSDIESGSGDYYAAGDILTIEDIMLSMMLPSSNTAAKAFGHHIGKKIVGESATAAECKAAFVAAMNSRAALVGGTHSEFDSASGLSSTNKSTANDLLKLVVDACAYPEIMRVWGKKTATAHVGGSNPRDVSLSKTCNATLEAEYRVLGWKTGNVGSNWALVMVAEEVS